MFRMPSATATMSTWRARWRRSSRSVTTVSRATPDAGLLMSAWEVDHQDAVDRVRARYPGIQLAGSSSAGEMSSILGFREDSVALALFASDTIDIVVGLGRDLAADPLAAARRAVTEATAKTVLPPRLCVVVSTIGGVEAGVILDALRIALGPGIPIIGGGAVGRDPGPRPTARPASSSRAMSSPAMPWPSCCSPARWPSRSAWRQDGGASARERRPRGRPPRACSRSTDDPRWSSTSGTSAAASHRRPTRWPSSRRPGSDSFYLRTPMTYDRDVGSISFFGAIPEGASVQLTMAGTDEIVEGTRASVADALAGFPAGARPDGALLFSCATRKFLLGTRAGREIDLVRDDPGGRRADRRVLLPGRDRAAGVGRPHPVPQRHDGVGPSGFRGGGRDRTSLTTSPPANPRPTSSRRRIAGSSAVSTGSMPTSAGSRRSRTPTRSSSRGLTELEKERARSERCCSTCCPSGSSTGWRPGRR